MSYLLLFLLLAQDQPTFHSDVALVHVDAEVHQDGQLISGLGRESFRVTDSGKPQAITYFGHQEQPLDAVVLFDTRIEMRPAVQRVAEASHTALGELRRGDRLAVMAFGGSAGNCKTDLISDLTGDFDGAERSIENQILQREFRPHTNLCSIQKGLDGAAQILLHHPMGNRRRAIIIITDDQGVPTRPVIVHDAVRDLWKADAVVLGVVTRSGATGFSIGPPYRGARYAADQTGGEVLNTGDPVEDLREMIRRLRLRYTLYYALPPAKRGDERKIRVQLTPEAAKRYPRAIVRARTGYVVPGENP